MVIAKILSPYLSSIRLVEDNGQINESAAIPSNNLEYDKVSSIKNNVGTTEERLDKLKEQDSRINTIISNYNDYPEELVDMLSRNIDMLDFVLNYPNKKGNVYSDNIGNISKGKIPLLLQWDERWGYANYGENIIAINGCGPTALSMVLAGLKGDSSITPYKIAKYAENNGYYVSGSGSSWSLMSDAPSAFGVKSEEIPLYKDTIMSILKKGQPIICIMGEGDFTTTGHFIVLTGIEDGKIKVNDPNSKVRSILLWDYDRIAPQIRNLWTFYVK
ncbi:MAG: C39 family peptidase [Bacilli bacterium]|nr:C39 family peptidase [Bacilli bacterium]